MYKLFDRVYAKSLWTDLEGEGHIAYFQVDAFSVDMPMVRFDGTNRTHPAKIIRLLPSPPEAH